MHTVGEIEKDLECARASYRFSFGTCPDALEIETYRAGKNWRTEFDDDEIDELTRLLAPDWPLPHAPHMSLGHFIGMLEGLVHSYQSNLWIERTNPRRFIHETLDECTNAVALLEATLKPDKVYLLRPIIVQQMGQEALSGILKALSDLRTAIEIRSNVSTNNGRPPDTARHEFAVLLALRLNYFGFPVNKNEDGIFMQLLAIMLPLVGKAGRSEKIEHLAIRAIDDFEKRRMLHAARKFVQIFVPWMKVTGHS